MNSKQRIIAFVGCAGLGLSGCGAAVIPVAASGLIGGSKLRHHRQPHVAKQARPAPASVAQAPSPAAAPVAPLPALPTDLSTMKMGQTYRGSLPSPTGTIAAPASPPASPATVGTTVIPTAGTAHPNISTWSDVMHFAASSSLHQPTDSTLLAKGSTIAAPHWLPCGNKPVAVLVNLPAADGTTFFATGTDNLGAIETMGVTLLFASDQPASVVARQLGVLIDGGVGKPVAGTTLFVGKAGQDAEIRAMIGGRYCVVAVVGSRAADFPNAVVPGSAGANPGWFLIR